MTLPRLVALLLLPFASEAASLAEMQSAVVLTRSEHGTGIQWKGSGLVFHHGSKDYLITSDHVILHENGETRHYAEGQDRLLIGAKYLVSDWGYGLSLLEVMWSPPYARPALDDLQPAPVKPGDPVITCGYPAQSGDFVADDFGQIRALTSQINPHPLVPSLLDLQDAHGEFGMSGGPVFTPEGGFVGMLSHQYLTNDPGHPGSPENNLLVIPASEIHAWLTRYFANPRDFAVYFHNDPIMQLDQPGSVYSGDLYFWLSSDPWSGAPEVVITLANPNPSRFMEDPHAKMQLEEISRALKRPGVNAAKIRGFTGMGGFKTLPEFFLRLRDPELRAVISYL